MPLKNLLNHASRWAKVGLLGKISLKARSTYLAYMKRQVRDAANPSLRLNAFAKSSLLPLRTVDLFLLTLLGQRDPLFIRLLDNEEHIKPPTVRVLLRIYGADYRGQAVSTEEIHAGLETLRKARWRPTRSNAMYFMLAAIKNGDLHLVQDVLDAFSTFPLKTLPSVYKIGVLRLAAQCNKDAYQTWREKAVPSALEQLQIQDIDHLAGFAAPLSHAKLGVALRAVVPVPMQAELDARVLPFYTEHAAQMVWMDCRIDPEERAQFVEDIEDHLRRKIPYSLIRLGDGESYAWKDKITAEHAARREQVWWGTQIDVERRARISDAMLSAISNATRLGIPSLFRFTRDTHLGLGSYTKHVSIAGLIHVLDGVKKLPDMPRLYTEERIHQLCFDLPTIARLCPQATKVVIVSSLTKATVKTKLSSYVGDVPLEIIEVPTHTKTRGNDMFVQAEQALPFVYERIEAQIAATTVPGTLVLVASGSIGKVFCAAAQRQGGVALDVGAMIDYWVGLKTRSIADLA